VWNSANIPSHHILKIIGIEQALLNRNISSKDYLSKRRDEKEIKVQEAPEAINEGGCL